MSEFIHNHAAHCESGVMSTMMKQYGLELSEPMVFGLSGGMNFAYLPFIKLGGLPLIAYRSMPRAIVKGLEKSIGLKMKLEKFSSAQKGQIAFHAMKNNVVKKGNHTQFIYSKTQFASYL